MIFPLGHEHTTVRRLPWVTFSIMALCFLAFIPTHFEVQRIVEEIDAEGERVLTYYFAHPYLVMPEKLQEYLAPYFRDESLAALPELAKQFGNEAPDSERQIEREQEQFDQMVERFFSRLEKTPYHQWGLIPAEMHAYALVTHQFMHGGWLHLFGNLFFLYLAGPFIEDVWGRPLFAGFYLVGGVLAGTMYAIRYPEYHGALIGASGAVAAVMGAFLVRYTTTKIRFFYWFFFVFVGTFTAPAWIMLPMWLLREMFFAQAMDVVTPGGGGGVAHWAHIWGFFFGLAFAGVLKYFNVEERFLHKSIESKITLVDNTVVEQALDASSQGRPGDAFDLLRKELRANPGNEDAALAFWNLASRHDRVREGIPHLLRVTRQAARRGDNEIVLSHWQELLNAAPDLKVEPGLALRIAEVLEENGGLEEAFQTLDLAVPSIGPETPSGVLVRLAKLAFQLGAPAAPVLIDAARANSETPDDARRELDEMAGTHEKVDSGPVELAAASPLVQRHAAVHHDDGDGMVGEGIVELEEIAELSQIAHTLQIMEVVPTGIGDGSIQLNHEGASRRMGLEQVQAIGVGGISVPNTRPYLVVDLMLDPPWSDREKLRVVRCLSSAFDPRKLMGGDDSMAAFRSMLETLLKMSEAVPLPDPEAARGRPFKTFTSVEAYERDVLGVG